MIDKLRALSAVRLEWAPQPDDVWAMPRYHVDALHREIADEVQAAVAEARTSPTQSPLGLVITGQRGAGKTHLLGAVRQHVQADGAYFFLVSLGEGSTFWESTALSILEGMLRPAGDAPTQLTSLLRRLALAAKVPVALHGAVSGDGPLKPEDLNQFVTEIRRLDHLVGQQCRDTARALVLYGSEDPAQQDVGHDYLLSMNEMDPRQRTRWGMQQGAKPAQRIVHEISRLLALTAPSVIAIDQFDDLVIRTVESRLNEGAEPTATSLAEMDLIAGGFMALRQATRRTVCVLSCLPTVWHLIEDKALETIPDRFRTVAVLDFIRDTGLAQELVAKRLGMYYDRVGFTPPYPTWPVRPEAFGGTVNLTPRRLLQIIDGHIRACVREKRVEELPLLDSVDPGLPLDVPPDELSTLDKRFAELRATANVRAALDPDTEDAVMPELLAAGLACWIDELPGPDSDFSYDPPPGAKPALHARLRHLLDEETGAEAHWSFRAIASASPVAALTRLRNANVQSGIGQSGSRRRLILLREDPWSGGARTQQALAAGGVTLASDADDLATFAALLRMRDDANPSLRGWLLARQPAHRTRLLSTVLADGDSAALTGRDRHGPGPGDTRPDGGVGAGPLPALPKQTGGAASHPPRPRHPLLIGVSTGDSREVSVELESLRRHTAIFAGSGSGKTVLIRRIVEECALQGISSIVLDPNNDLARLGDAWPAAPEGWRRGDDTKAARYLADTDVVIWTPRREAGRPLSFQPLPDFTSVLSDPDEFRAAVDAAVAALAPRAKVDGATNKAVMGQAVLNEAMRHYAHRGGTDLRGFISMLSALPRETSQLDKAEKIAADMAQLLTAAMVIDPLFGGDGTPVDPGELLRPAFGKKARISVVSLVGLTSDEQRQSFVNQLQMALFAWVKRHPAGDRPLGGLFVMDEAQSLAPSGAMTACTHSTLALASQARKYGLGLVFATQAPKALHNRIPGNAATQFFGLLSAPTQIDAAREMARAKGSDIPDIGRLGRGEFYAAPDGASFVKIQAPNCLSYHPKSPLTTEEVIERARGVPRPAAA